jgi:hypothetical protein
MVLVQVHQCFVIQYLYNDLICGLQLVDHIILLQYLWYISYLVSTRQCNRLRRCYYIWYLFNI